MTNIIKTIYGRLLDWSGLANVPAALKALAGLKGSVGQIIEISGTSEDGTVSALTAVDKPDGAGSGDNLSGADVTRIKTVLGNIMTIIKAQVEDSNGTPQGYDMDVSGLVSQNDALIAALGGSGDTTEKTLTSISAVYSGGSVPVGTAVSALTGVVVTAHYSDGTSEAVTGYTLSGSIVEGENTITVTYQGKTTVFAVMGTAETGGGDPGGETGVSNETTWTNGVVYTFEAVEDEYVEANGVFASYETWNRTPYLYCKGAALLRAVVNTPTTVLGTNNAYNAFYDDNKDFIEPFNYTGIDGTTAGAYKDITIPANAAYFVASHKEGVIGMGGNESNMLGFVPYSEVPV